ncbi:MAG: 23S rRNA (adenine(2503)-C(2))-methyltransferase RlmN [Oligoflexales bacterium]
MTDLYTLNVSDLANLLKKNNISKAHAKPILQNLWHNQLHPFNGPGLPRSLQKLPWSATISVTLTQPQQSRFDGSVKFLTKLNDDLHVETVLMPERNRVTLCISSQVGCQQACSFCHTGRMGLVRQLTTAEITGQVAAANQWITQNPTWLDKFPYKKHDRVTNVVFMGMGEPLDNVPAVAQAVSVLLDLNAAGIAQRKLTVSTAGHLDGLKEFVAIHPRVPVALSLHAVKHRARLLPIEKRFPVKNVLAFLSQKAHEQKNFFLVQYTLIHGVNDSVEEAQNLAELLRKLPVKINLIPFNEFSASSFSSPQPENIENFRAVLKQADIRTMVRYSKAQDVDGACGQLAVRQA